MTTSALAKCPEPALLAICFYSFLNLLVLTYSEPSFNFGETSNYSVFFFVYRLKVELNVDLRGLTVHYRLVEIFDLQLLT